MWRIHKNKILFLASQLQHTNKESSLFPLADGNYYERGLLVFHFRSNHLTLALQKETNLKVSDKNLSLKTKLICPSWKTSTCLYYHWKFSFGSFLKIKKQKPDWRQCLNWKAVLTESEARLTILFRLRFCFDFLPPDHHGHGSHGHGGHGRGRGLSHRAEGNSNRDWNSISRPRRIETEPIKNLLKLDSSFWINLSQNHRDRSIQIERACQLHDTKMAQHGLQLKGFNISCLRWALVY